MKTWNFPEKVNARRKSALARLATNDDTAAERVTLTSRIRQTMRDVRTKITRTARMR
jgi:hypothetical protein